MSRRRRSTTGDSLDMLLDAMCNTFGCLIFIAMLLTVIAGNAVEGLSEPTDEEYLEQQRELGKLREKLDDLRRKRDRAAAEAEQKGKTFGQKEKVHDELGKDPVKEKVAGEIEQNEKRRDDAENELETVKQGVANGQVAVTKIETEIGKLTEELDGLKEKTQEKHVVERKVLTLEERRFDFYTRLALKGGKLYAISAFPPQKEYFDKVDVGVDDKKDRVEVKLNADAGQVIDEQAASTGKWGEMLKRMEPTKHAAIVSLFPDSFDTFQYVKNALIARGIKYTWYPASGDVITLHKVANTPDVPVH